MKEEKENDKAEKESNENKKEVCEVFDIEKDGKEKEIKVCGEEEVKEIGKGQISRENKILRNVLIAIGFVVLVLVVAWFVAQTMVSVEYKGVNFKMIREGNLIFYQTSFPVIYNGKNVNYNFYIRNSPRKLKDMKMDTEGFAIPKNMVINSTGDFACDGDGIIAIANLVKLFELAETKIIKNETLGCSGKDYMFLQIQEGNETKIEKTAYNCYTLHVADCEILEATERLMLEAFVEIDGYM